MRNLEERLGKLNTLKREMKLLDDRMAKEKRKLEVLEMSRTYITVQQSQHGEPYQKVATVVSGLTARVVSAKARQRRAIQTTKALIEEQRAECTEECAWITEFIRSAPSSEMRQILTMKYVNGKSNQQIANFLGYRDEKSVRNKLKDFFKKSEKSELDNL